MFRVHFPNARAAFTLLELLVVIAIIAVLAGLLMPVIGSVNKKSGAVTVISNLKQVGAAIALYAADNNNVLPVSTSTLGNPSYPYGLQPAVHTWVKLLAADHRGTGAYNDPGTRLGARIAPYIGIKGAANTEVAVPILRDPLWKKAVESNQGPVEMYWSAPTFILHKYLRKGLDAYPDLPADPVTPWGTDGTKPEGLSGSMSYLQLLGGIGPASQTWAMIQCDKGLVQDSGNDITLAMVHDKAPAAPVLGNYRLALMFDWSVQQIPAGTDLRRPFTGEIKH